jgi:hypothetical protein
LGVKKRLYKKYQDILSGLNTEKERKEELGKIYDELERDYKLLIDKLKSNMEIPL